MVNANLIFGGVEGGGTHSWIVLMDGRGKKIAELEGPSTNRWLMGLKECLERICKLVQDAKEMAGVSQDTILEGLGLCLSGCEEDEANRQMEKEILEQYPNLTKHVVVASDTQGSIATACHNGGIVLISGTGSNALLLNPDGKTFRCGGWGHMLGDEGGAYWIAARAVKILFDEDDNLIDPPFCTAKLRNIVYSHFDLKDRFGMLQHVYTTFEKAKFASLAAKISEGAAQGDPMCGRILYDGGFALGRHISALSRNMHPDLFAAEDGLQIVCSGSVWKSWEYLREGFVDGVQPQLEKDEFIPKFKLLRLAVTSALGAIYLGALKAGYDIPRDYSKNVKPFFTYIHPAPQTASSHPTKSTAKIAITINHDNGHACSNGKATETTNGQTNGTHCTSITNGNST
ncbi:N-acetyl-D-glucosamine kinase-like isoform X2 [Homarus americanus]|uniref:N-acetyl-D-glucosamine kinase-like isoform X2 n=1 Tax=Homarus americanus TaxID=6706 RepID=UPI001C48E910|nr:N-acetyl-D-glucosamine kinase-like isoform X2 [Homarus americanus]